MLVQHRAAVCTLYLLIHLSPKHLFPALVVLLHYPWVLLRGVFPELLCFHAWKKVQRELTFIRTRQWSPRLVWRAVAVRHAASISAASTQRCAHAQRRCLPREASHAIGAQQHEPKRFTYQKVCDGPYGLDIIVKSFKFGIRKKKLDRKNLRRPIVTRSRARAPMKQTILLLLAFLGLASCGICRCMMPHVGKATFRTAGLCAAKDPKYKVWSI